MQPSIFRFVLLVLLALPGTLTSCASTYYSAMEGFGVHKRDILVSRVEKGREDQAEAQEQFKTTLEAFQEVTSFDGGDLEKLYKRLNNEYEDSEDAAEAVSDRIQSIQKVSTALFKEWTAEIEEIGSADLRRKSQGLMDDTQTRYKQLIGKMTEAESKMAPVLAAFKDHTLFLKHNLNAQAIDSLKDSVLEIEGDVAALVANMQASIDEADAFIAAMSS